MTYTRKDKHTGVMTNARDDTHKKNHTHPEKHIRTDKQYHTKSYDTHTMTFT